MRVKKLARLSLLAAVSFVLLFLACVIPTGKLALTAMAGLVIAPAVIEAGLAGGSMCWAVTSALALLVLPAKSPAILYALFFGVYPVVKSLIERLGVLWLEWLCKLGYFMAILSVYVFAFKELFMAEAKGVITLLPAVYAAGAVVFALYDIGSTKLIAFYMSRRPGGGPKN